MLLPVKKNPTTTVVGLSLVVPRTEPEGLPKSLDDVGGDGSAAFVGVGLPGEGDCASGHLGHDRFLRRPRELDELGSSGRRRTSIFWHTNRKRVVKLEMLRNSRCGLWSAEARR